MASQPILTSQPDNSTQHSAPLPMASELSTSSHGIGTRTPWEHALIGLAKGIPTGTPCPVYTLNPVILPAPGRLFDLQIRISAPTIGTDLPIILLSHGYGNSYNLSSSNGYAPLTNFWAARGFVVIQPTHLSSRSLNVERTTRGAPFFWRSRVADIKFIIDQLDQLEILLPMLSGRLDQGRIAVAGHSMGCHTASMLLGARLTDPEDGTIVDLSDARIKAGLLLAPPGNGHLCDFAATNLSFFKLPSYTSMATPTLVVVGENHDPTQSSLRGTDRQVDSYRLSPSPKNLAIISGAQYGLGGVAGYDAAETMDESPERLAVTQRLTWAYLRSVLFSEDPAWARTCAALERFNTLARVESK